jgi:hypothetical protein
VNPRPPPFVLVRKRILGPLVSLIPSSPCERRIHLTCRRKLIGAVDQLLEPGESLERGVELVRGVNRQRVIEQKQADELAGLENGALSVLARNHKPDLERRPLPIAPLPESVLEHERLPRIEMQTRRSGEIDGFGSERRVAIGNREDLRFLHRRNYHCRDTFTFGLPAVARLQRWCSGPV